MTHIHFEAEVDEVNRPAGLRSVPAADVPPRVIVVDDKVVISYIRNWCLGRVDLVVFVWVLLSRNSTVILNLMLYQTLLLQGEGRKKEGLVMR